MLAITSKYLEYENISDTEYPELVYPITGNYHGQI
jgi:hypothetical protein